MCRTFVFGCLVGLLAAPVRAQVAPGGHGGAEVRAPRADASEPEGGEPTDGPPGASESGASESGANESGASESRASESGASELTDAPSTASESGASESGASAAAHGTTGVGAADASPPSDAPPAPDADTQAWTLFVAGRDAYHGGDFAAAAAHWERAFALSGRPQLLLSLGNAFDHLSRPADAAQAIRQYLLLVPDASLRPTLEVRLGQLENAARDAARRTRLRRPATLAFASASILTGVAGGIFWARANSRYDALLATCGARDAGCAPGQVDVVSRHLKLTNASFGLALTFALTAAILYVIEGRSP